MKLVDDVGVQVARRVNITKNKWSNLEEKGHKFNVKKLGKQ
jgi:hypothetical protein